MKCLLAFCSLVLATSCGGSSAAPGAPGSKAKVVAANGARVGSDVDALWTFAPADTAIGIVVAPGTTLKLYDVAEEILRVIEARPLGAKAMQDARKEMSELPFDIFDRKAFAQAGVDLSLGAALFLDSQNGLTVVLPISDRKAFRKITEATEISVAGQTLDNMDNEMFCSEARSHYVCMQTAEALVSRIGAGTSSFSKRVYRLPSSYRGDAELVMDILAFEEMEGERDEELHEMISEPGLLAAVMQLDSGSVTARFWMQGKLRGDLGTIVEASKSVGALSDQVARMKPSTLLRMIMPMQMVSSEVPDESLPGGFRLKADVLEKMTGEIVAYAPSSKTAWGRISLGITEAKAFRSLLNMACTMMPPMDFLKVQKGEGRCDFVIDWDKMPNVDPEMRSVFNGKMLASAAVADSQVSLTIGSESPLLGNSQVSEIGRELLEQEWSYSFWTQNLSLISSLNRPWSKVINRQPKEMQEGMRYGLWLLSHVSEVAVALSLQADGMHVMAHIGTYASDPEETYKAYQAAVTKNIDVGDSRGAFAEIRKRWPTSQAAQQSAVANPFSVFFAELVASVSVPAYVKYMTIAEATKAGFVPGQ